MSINILNFKALVGAFNKDKALVGKLRNFAKVLCQLYAAYICIVCCVVWPVSAPAGFCEDYIRVTMSGHCECARAAGNTMQRVHTVQGSCFICRYWHGAQCGSEVRDHVTLHCHFSLQLQLPILDTFASEFLFLNC